MFERPGRGDRALLVVLDLGDGAPAERLAEIRRRRVQLLALAAGLVGGGLLLAAVILLQRYRLRVERRMRAVTDQARQSAEEAKRLKYLEFAGIHEVVGPARWRG